VKYIIYFISILLAFGLTAGLFSQVSVLGAVPNIVLLLVVVSALEKGSLDFVFLAILGGLVLDFYSGLFVGSYSFSLLLVGYMLQFVVNNVLVEEVTWYNLLFMVLLSVLVTHGFVYGYNYLLFNLHIANFYLDPREFLKLLLPLLAYHLLLAYPAYALGTGIRNIIASLKIKRHRF
jgi:rod shape-determining protein MreD